MSTPTGNPGEDKPAASGAGDSHRKDDPPSNATASEGGKRTPEDPGANVRGAGGVDENRPTTPEKDENSDANKPSADSGMDDRRDHPSIPGGEHYDPLDPADYGEPEYPPMESGFTIRTILGALFIGFIMLPGTIYLGLTAGLDISTAIEWVTVILFLELARRSFQRLTRQEIYVLLHVAGNLGIDLGGHALAGGIFATLIWNSYMKTGEEAKGFNLPDQLPVWVTPAADIVAQRELWHSAWIPAIVVAIIGALLGKVSQISMSYIVYRFTADVEKLPFPLAKIAAQGAIALAEHSGGSESWRWNVFSIGAMIGAVFALLYTAPPIISGAILASPVQFLPIPFADMTSFIETILPGAVFGITFNLGMLLIGMIMPWKVVIGIIVGSVLAQYVANPFLYSIGMLENYEPGRNAVFVQFYNNLDFWLSVTIGTAIFVTLVGLWSIGKSFVSNRSGRMDWSALTKPPANRGDLKLRWFVIAYFAASLGFVALGDALINWNWATGERKPPEAQFNILWLVAFAFLYTPLMSYMSARMVGITGHGQPFPFVRQGSFFLSGYPRPDLWFAPVPLADYGAQAQHWRVTALTGTPVKSILKAELLAFPIMLICSFMFWGYIWSIAPIPGPEYPYAQMFWPMQAQNQALWATAQSEGTSYLLDAIKWPIIGGTVVVSFFIYGGLGLVGLSTGYFYGAIRGIVDLPHITFVIFAGALMGRYYFARKFGPEQWRKYIPVLIAGYFCGFGLSGLVSIAIVFFSKAVYTLPY